MAWYHRTRERLQRTPDGELAPAPAKEQQATKLAEFEEFKPAPLAMSENLPVPVDAKNPLPAPTTNLPATTTKARTSAPAPQPAPTAKSAPAVKPKEKPKGLFGTLRWAFTEEETETEEEAKKKAEEAKAKAKEPEPKPDVKTPPTPAQSTRVAPAKPAPQVATVTVTVGKIGLTREEIAELKAKEAALEAKVDRARQDFKALAANEENAEKAYKEYPAYAKRLIGWVDEMIDMAEERADAQAASHYRKKIIEIRRDEPPKPKQFEKPTYAQYVAKHGIKKHTFKNEPKARDLANAPFQAEKPHCSVHGGYKPSENCKNCRAMNPDAYCPCKCGSYSEINPDHDYHRHAGPDFKVGGKINSQRGW